MSYALEIQHHYTINNLKKKPVNTKDDYIIAAVKMIGGSELKELGKTIDKYPSLIRI